MSPIHNSDGGIRVSRRDALRLGLCGAGGLLAGNSLGSKALAAAAKSAQAPAQVKAKSVIQIFLWGGMSHNDTWDPKPDAGREYMGEFGEVVERLSEAVFIARKTLLVIKQNLFWAFAYNFVTIPLAASGLLAPVWAAIAMATSSVLVVGNSLRLGRLIRRTFSVAKRPPNN